MGENPQHQPSTLKISYLAALTLVIGIGAVIFASLNSDKEPMVPVRAEPELTYDPVQAGVELPDGYRPFLDRDLIRPVYEPTFAISTDVDWPDDSLVIGVVGTATAKAYPVTHLNQREMVNDELDGSPILVSW